MITAACIVVHRPDVTRLVAAVRAVAEHVGCVVVVADGCEDVLGLARALRGSAQVLPTSHVTGPGAATNLGVDWLAERGADAVLLLDQHAVVEDGAVAALTAHLDDPRVAIVAGSAVAERAAGSALPDRTVAAARYVDACAVPGSLVRVSAWHGIGGCDEAIVGEYAGYDLCFRTRRAGHAIVHEPAAVVRSAGQVPAAALDDMAHDAVYFARKHRGVSRAVRVAGRGLLRTYGALAARAVDVMRHETDRRTKVRGIVRGALAGSMARVAA